MRMRPYEGRSSPASMRSVVVLPQPDGPTRTMNSPASRERFKSSTAVSAPKILWTPSNLTSASMSAPHRAAEAERAAEISGHEQVQDDHREREQQREHGQVAELEKPVRAHEVVDLDRSWLVVRVAVEDERDDECAPRVDERVDGRHRDPRNGERQYHLAENAEGARAVDRRRVLELGRHRVDEVLHEPDRERQGARGEE